MNSKILNRHPLSGNNKYSFCPFCIKRLSVEGRGEDFKTLLRPLIYVETASPMKQIDGSFVWIKDEHYECPNCKNTNITIEHFRNFYTKNADSQKWEQVETSEIEV